VRARIIVIEPLVAVAAKVTLPGQLGLQLRRKRSKRLTMAVAMVKV